MSELKTLSDKELVYDTPPFYPKKDVKEAIQKVKQLIKDSLVNFSYNNNIDPKIAGAFSGQLRNKINKIFGEKLIWVS